MTTIPRASCPTPAKKEGPTPADWDRHRTTITDLYAGQGKTLKELMDIMQTEHNFTASAKMYNNRFKWWGIGKNMRARDAVAILTLQTRRQLAGRGRSEYVVKGKTFSADRLERYWRRANRVRIEKACDQLWQTSSLPYGVEVRTPDPSPPSSPLSSSSTLTQDQLQRRQQQYNLDEMRWRRPSSPLDQRQISPPDSLQLPEEMLHCIRKFYGGYFEASPAACTRSLGLSSFMQLKERLVRFDSQFQALAYILVEPPGDIMFRQLDVFYTEMRDQMKEHDHFLLPMCLHSVYFLAGDPRSAPISRMLLSYIKEGSDIFLGPLHPLTTLWKRLWDHCNTEGLPGRDFFYALGRYINDRLLQELGEYNVLYLRILHHFIWTYEGHEAFQNAIESRIAHLEALMTAVLGPTHRLPSNPPESAVTVASDYSLLASYPSPHSYSSYSPPFSSSPAPLLDNASPPHPITTAAAAFTTADLAAVPTSAEVAAIDPADLAYANEMKTILSGSLAFGLYVAGRHEAARAVALRTLSREAVRVLPAVRGCLHSVVGNIQFAAGDVAAAVADARLSIRLSELAGASRLVVVARLSRLAVFLERSGDARGADEAKARIEEMLPSIGMDAAVKA